MRARPRSGGAGLTLIEFLFATSIMAFVALGVAGMFPAALKSVMVGGFTTRATALAQQMADAVRTDAMRIEGFNALVSTYNGVSTASVTANCSTPTVLTPLQKWRCDLTATMATDTGQGLPAGVGTIAVTCLNPDGTVNTANSCSTDLRRVTVTVTWDRTGSRTVSVVTNVARPN